MNTTKLLPWTAAVAVHAAVVAAVVLWPRAGAQGQRADFTAENLVQLPVDFTEGAPRTCTVHNLEMKVAVVPIAYGLFLRFDDPEKFAALHPHEPSEVTRAEQFPNNNPYVWGGCCVQLERFAKIYVCVECKRAEEKWRLAKQQAK